MHIRDAQKVARLEPIGGDQFEARSGGVNYNFGVTPLGRIYRVQSSQRLGLFAIDGAFLKNWRSRLITKYGRPIEAAGDSFTWELIEPVNNILGQMLPFRTNWFSAYVSSGHRDTVSVEMTMIDFRILWADQVDVNRAPRQAAESAVRF